MANRFSGPRSARRSLACKLGRPPLRPDPAKAPQRTAAVASFLNKVTADMPVPVKAISVEDPGLEITLRAAALSPDTALPRTVQGGGLGSEVASIRRILIEWRPEFGRHRRGGSHALVEIGKRRFRRGGALLLCLPRAEAVEVFDGPSLAAHMNDGLITQVRGAAAGVACVAAVAECTGAAEWIAVVSTEGAAVSIEAAMPCIAAAAIAVALTAAALIVAGPTAIAAALIVAAIVAIGPGPGGTAGDLAAPSRPALRSASSARRLQPHGPDRRQGQACAGTIPTPADGRGFGTLASRASAFARAA